MKICTNVLCVQNFRVVLALNEYFSDKRAKGITKKGFMELQKLVWDSVKKDLNIKIKHSAKRKNGGE